MKALPEYRETFPPVARLAPERDARRWWALALVCGALGVAIVSTVAVSLSEDYLAANAGAIRSSC
jgi:hypothetical protein